MVEYQTNNAKGGVGERIEVQPHRASAIDIIVPTDNAILISNIRWRAEEEIREQKKHLFGELTHWLERIEELKEERYTQDIYDFRREEKAIQEWEEANNAVEDIRRQLEELEEKIMNRNPNRREIEESIQNNLPKEIVEEVEHWNIDMNVNYGTNKTTIHVKDGRIFDRSEVNTIRSIMEDMGFIISDIRYVK